MDIPRGKIPANRLLALDGRNKGHLSNADEHNHVPLGTGSLFWAINRTAVKEDANLFLEFCYMTASHGCELTVCGDKRKVNMKKGDFPGIPILVNKNIVDKNTRLLAMDDVTLVRAREEDQKQELEKKKRASSGPGDPAPSKKQKV